MKKFFFIPALVFLFSLISFNSNSQAPQSVPYQAVARNSSGNLIQNQTVSIRFTIHSGSAAGTIVYQETQPATTSSLGLFSVNIGQGIPISTYGPFSGIDWGSAPKFTQVEIDITGGTSYMDMGTQQMLSVPYALYAETSGHAVGSVTYMGTWDASANSPTLLSNSGTKGFYYVVINAGVHDLNGITEWGVGDWAIYNGTIWQKVDNSSSVSDAESVTFTPAGNISSTNVQDALAEVDGQFADLIDSYIHQTEDGLTIYLPPGGPSKRLGIGDTLPAAPLGIKGETGGDDRMISFKSNDALQKWNINLNPTSSNVAGFSIDDASSGLSSSRLFIDHAGQGNVGIGTVAPIEKLSVSGNADNASASMSIVNTASAHNGWLMAHADDNLVAERNGAFSITEKSATTLNERITVLPTANVGINETMPYATLHVTRPASDPMEQVALVENTGIIVLGPIDDKNLAFDSHQIQARTGSYVGGGSTLAFTATELNLQPLGGNIIIHSAMAPEQKVTITGDGMVGLGKNPVERLDVNGAITLGDAAGTTPANGTIRWSGTDFEGRKAGTWVSMTSGSLTDGFVSGGTDVIYYEPASGNPKVGIGLSTPLAALHVEENAAVTSDVVTTKIESKSTNSGTTDNTRVGLEIVNSLSWSSNALSKDVGLYIKQVSGQSNHESNLAAVFNGNTVIGDLVSGNTIVGAGGRNVLVIQNGDVPTSQAGSSLLSNGGIQIYSHTDALGTSVFTLMNGDGTIIQLYRAPALSTSDNSVISTTSYGATEATVINNLRTRLNELESKLQAIGLLQ